MQAARPIPTPMQTNIRLQKDVSPAMHDPSMFHSVVGALQSILITHPKFSYAVNNICQFMHNPQEYHWKVVKCILRYIVGTSSHGLLIQHSPTTQICAFNDADWGSDIDDRKSTTGYYVYYKLNIIAWSSHKQRVVLRSITKA